MKKAYSSSSKSAQKVSFSGLFGLICHYSPNSQKNLLFALTALLFISSCKDKKTDPVENKVTSIAIEPSSPAVAIGLTQQLTATVLPADAAKKEVTWSTGDETKATVDATGKVTGVAKGTAVITATATDGSNVKGTVTVNITVKATSVVITPAEPSVAVGGNLTFTAAVLPAEAPQAVKWTSSDPTKATIDAATGAATGIAAGSVTITAAAADGSGIAGTVMLTVNEVVIVLGEECFNVPLPAAGGTTRLANAPRTATSNIRSVKVNITAPANAAIKVNNRDFTQGQTVDFTNPATFTVTAQGGAAKSYTINIPAYNATDNPYGIYTVKHLVDVANGLTASYLLKNNIDLPNKDAADAADVTGLGSYPSAGWLPLDFFSGTFDGGNFSINNFYVNHTADHVGLFGYMGRGGVIKNLGVNGVSGTAAAGSSFILTQNTGILVGYSVGTIDKCYATGNVSSSNSSSFSGSYAGGLVGYNSGTISNSYATGNVSASASFGNSSYAGGLAGDIAGGGISNSYATGNVSASASSGISSFAGGLVGDNGGKGISNSYATGSVSATIAGGLAGNSLSPISNSYATGSVSSSSSSDSDSCVGGLAGINGGRISNSYAAGSVSSSSSGSCVGGLAGQNEALGQGGSISNSYATGSVSSSSSSYIGGLAGKNERGSISNSYATGNVSSSGRSYAGGLVGDNVGNSYSGEGGSISNSYATGSVSSLAASGGLVGHNDSGSISNSYATGNVSSSGRSYAGGLVGTNESGRGTFTNCYRNSNAAIKKDNADARPSDASVAGIVAKTKAEMQMNPFKDNLNGTSGTVWGRDDSKNDKLPYIIGVGVGG